MFDSVADEIWIDVCAGIVFSKAGGAASTTITSMAYSLGFGKYILTALKTVDAWG
jgi:hypothetical protein